jgi:hypothetical protein
VGVGGEEEGWFNVPDALSLKRDVNFNPSLSTSCG